MEQLISNIAGNGVIGAILVWFMIQHMELVKQLKLLIEKGHEVINENTQAMTKVHDAIDKYNAPRR